MAFGAGLLIPTSASLGASLLVAVSSSFGTGPFTTASDPGPSTIASGSLGAASSLSLCAGFLPPSSVAIGFGACCCFSFSAGAAASALFSSAPFAAVFLSILSAVSAAMPSATPSFKATAPTLCTDDAIETGIGWLGGPTSLAFAGAGADRRPPITPREPVAAPAPPAGGFGGLGLTGWLRSNGRPLGGVGFAGTPVDDGGGWALECAAAAVEGGGAFTLSLLLGTGAVLDGAGFGTVIPLPVSEGRLRSKAGLAGR